MLFIKQQDFSDMCVRYKHSNGDLLLFRVVSLRGNHSFTELPDHIGTATHIHSKKLPSTRVSPVSTKQHH